MPAHRRVVLLVGLPGSGKSTWLRERGIVAISSDEVRRVLSGSAEDQSINARVFDTVRYLLRQRLEIGQDLTFIDATNLTRWERAPYIEMAKEFDAAVEAVLFDVPLDECKRRNAARDRVVPDAAMEKLASKFEPPLVDEGLSRVFAPHEFAG